MQWRPAGLVHVGAAFDQLFCQLLVALERRQHQNAFIFRVENVDIRFRPLDQHLCHLQRRLTQCDVQAVQAFRVERVGIEATGQEPLHRRRLVVQYGVEKIVIRSGINRTKSSKNK